MAKELQYSPRVHAYVTAAAIIKSSARASLRELSKADRDAVNAELDKISDRLIKSAQKIYDGEQYKKCIAIIKQKNQEVGHA